MYIPTRKSFGCAPFVNYYYFRFISKYTFVVTGATRRAHKPGIRYYFRNSVLIRRVCVSINIILCWYRNYIWYYLKLPISPQIIVKLPTNYRCCTWICVSHQIPTDDNIIIYPHVRETNRDIDYIIIHVDVFMSVRSWLVSNSFINFRSSILIIFSRTIPIAISTNCRKIFK